MLTMSQINHIKDLSNCGYRISEISKKTGTDPKNNTQIPVTGGFLPSTASHCTKTVYSGGLQADHSAMAGRRQKTLA